MLSIFNRSGLKINGGNVFIYETIVLSLQRNSNIEAIDNLRKCSLSVKLDKLICNNNFTIVLINL